MHFAHPLLRLDAIGAVMLLLVAFVGWAIARYSREYLAGEPPAALVRYRRALGATLACVAVVVLSNHLLLTAAAWVGTSLTLHVLLTHYGERWQALLAAHKKFIASRIAEIALFGGIALLGAATGTLQLDAMAAYVRAHGLGLQGQAGMTLIAVAALLKCAQLPAHGWLVQVMEAPTPVSALLHAGVINLSGFVLIRLADPLAAAPAAQWLLLMVAGTTAAVAALVAMTRVSIKVALAWSTCAQMGFMLLECALGLPELALLHLVSHSLYKAHAFLGAGETVATTRRGVYAPPPANVPLVHSAIAGGVALAAVGFGASRGMFSPGQSAAIAIAALAFASWVAASRGALAVLQRLLCGAALALLLFAWHRVFAGLVPPPMAAATPALALVAILVFTLLFALQALFRAAPQSALARRLHPWCFGGFFLDEHFTRLTFKIWPLRQEGIA